MILERLKFLRDYFNGDLPITCSIQYNQVVEILDSIINELTKGNKHDKR
jgi:hypothetical protein